MSSVAHYLWRDYGTELTEFEQIHRKLGRIRSPNRSARRHLNQVYSLMLASRFQAYCRELHRECVDYLVSAVSPAAIRSVIRQNFVAGRMLDRGNAHAENIGRDLNRLSLTFWDEVIALDAKNTDRRKLLDDLNAWRNAIAHHDFKRHQSDGSLTIAITRGWRRACDGLADAFDEVTRRRLADLIGQSPW